MRRAATSALFALVAACGDGAESSAPAPSRFESVEATDGDVDQVLRDVCDVSHPASSAPAWEWPTTDTAVAPVASKWTWVNFWATWCHPCLEEIPLLQRSLATGPFELRFVSADADAEALARFRTEHAFTAASPRLTEPGAMNAELTRVGFRGVPSLPVHVLLDPAGKVRCVRAGLVEARHLDRISGALGQQAAPAIR